MSYLVLARKYRPQTFADVIGQDHITEILKKAVESNRVAHAYLFCGPRGIGKTSCARILAKSLNCENGPTNNPCGKCPACLEIAKGTSFDVLEIDGASNRGIDEIRSLRENVKFAPSYGRYKIYIIDEVHQITTDAFNALLKTLEEPPEHVKFIFATTSPQKVPSTIISRCQRFDFKSIAIKTIVEMLASVCKEEKLTIDQEALYAVAKAAQGSFRDALSVLDQLSALSDEGIKADDVYSMLGLVETDLIFNLVDALGDKNCQKALEILEEIITKGKDVRQLAKNLNEHLRNLMVIKIGGKSLGKLVDYPIVIKDMFLAQCDKFTLKEIINAIDTLTEAQESARITESIRMSLEVAFAKLTYQGETKAPAPKLQKPEPAIQIASVKKPMPSAGILSNNKGEVDISGRKKEVVLDVVEEKIEVSEEGFSGEETGTLDFDRIKRMWDSLTYAVSRKRMSVSTYLQEGSPQAFKDLKLTVIFPPHCRFQKEALEDSQNVQIVEDVLYEKLKAKVRIAYELSEDFKSPTAEEPEVKEILDTFKGKITNKWHNE
ncbi:MAG: DNA polymerase III subunit gamma/tau [Candidatus Omnitrophica bacterium]|nr:DNA polymerase III subunit gamma/tau [Candidatus Omnitrophota bacterium]